MRFFLPHRIKFHGPDPPPFIPPPPVTESMVLDPKAAKQKKDEPVAPVEIPKTPEILAAEKMFIKFMKQMRREVDKMSSDLAEYRYLSIGPDAIKKVPLYPKSLSEAE